MKYVKIIWYILTIVPIILLILGYVYPSSFFSNQEQIRNFVESYGILAPIVFVIIQILQVVLTPISHYVVGLAGGFIFGTWYGFILNWIGRVIGTLIAFYLGRKFGRKIIKHVVKQETLSMYDKIFEKGKLILFLMYFLPLFPDDELSYLAGFSSMRARVFIPIMLLGHIGGSLGLAFLGSGLSYSNPLFIIFSVITLIAGILFVIFYKRHIKNN
ncbi:MAG: TVP38/TMEM64 family protein [Nanoarchaeota archaeon]